MKRILSFLASTLLVGLGAWPALAADEKLDNALRDLAQGNDQQRAVATMTLEGLGADAKRLVPDLIKLLEQDKDDFRLHVIEILGTVGPDAKAAVPALRKTLKHRDFHTQYFSCRALARIGPDAKDAVPDLIALLPVKASAASVRRNAAIALGKLGPVVGAQAVQALTECLTDRNSPVREDAATALGLLGELAQSSVPALRRAMGDTSASARIAAATSVWQITHSTDKVLDLLVAELESHDAPWQAAAAFAILGAAAEPAVPKIRTLLNTDDEEQRLYAVEALGNVGPSARAALADLRRLEKDPDEDVAKAAVEAIKKVAP